MISGYDPNDSFLLHEISEVQALAISRMLDAHNLVIISMRDLEKLTNAARGGGSVNVVAVTV